MIVVDSSVWIAFLRGEASALPFRDLIRAEAPIACTEPVAMEVLAGTKSAQQAMSERDLLTSRGWLPFDAAADFEAAADIDRRARASGITPRSHVDCMIIAVAARNDAALLTLDGQQAAVAGLAGVPLA